MWACPGLEKRKGRRQFRASPRRRAPAWRLRPIQMSGRRAHLRSRLRNAAALSAESRFPLPETQRAVEPLQPNPSVPVQSQHRRPRRGLERCSRSTMPSRRSFDAWVFAALDRMEPRNSKALHHPHGKVNTICQTMTMISTRSHATQVSRTAPHFGPAPRIEREQCSSRAPSPRWSPRSRRRATSECCAG